MGDEWIDIDEWQQLLRKSRRLCVTAEFQDRRGVDSQQAWQKVREVNGRIRSPYLKVRGIDDRRRDGLVR